MFDNDWNEYVNLNTWLLGLKIPLDRLSLVAYTITATLPLFRLCFSSNADVQFKQRHFKIRYVRSTDSDTSIARMSLNVVLRL